MLAAEGLVDAFGHVSARSGEGILITPATPLGRLRQGVELVAISDDADDLPPTAPKEAWLHLAIYRSRPDVGAICRAQPVAVAAVAATGSPIRALHGQGAFCGKETCVHDDARLVRTPELGEEVAKALGASPALVMRGNGAVTVGRHCGEAAARMIVFEASARINLSALAAESVWPLRDDEVSAWEAVAPEILERIWDHLLEKHAATARS